ncbi:hypothetical protein VIGAN_04154000 [Vigna angularis var. angularis]|uniref:Uncharacterized protein n=1 Tax=Vigna angularis var. angularis TaxID=157739 RepID=A0A0S3RUI1_PHAAN|nr:hypothetical protein VIGAN_04154000 [Vigna angularis var. angularis]
MMDFIKEEGHNNVRERVPRFIAPRTTLPLHLSFPLHASSTSPTTKLAELGFKMTAEKCKKKFEDESGYFDNVSNYGKNNYRFLSELEELCQNPYSGGGDGDCDGDEGIVRSEKTLLHLGADNMGHRQCDGTDDKVVVEKSKERKRKRRDRFEMFKGFCESFVNKMMAQQEEIHNRLLKDMVKRDQEKFSKEEAWKKQEMERMNKELDIMAQEHAIAGDKHATIIEFLKVPPPPVKSTTDRSR